MPPNNRQRIVKRLQGQIAAKTEKVADAATANDGGDTIAAPTLGQMRLFSYHAPSLKAGLYTITVDQLIHAPHTAADTDSHHTLNLHSTQQFEVSGLRFSLPSGAVHQTYPPQGHEEHNLILPHIIFNDSHLPWEQVASLTDDPPSLPGDAKPRNNIPWLALLVFTEDELMLTPGELQAISGPNANLLQTKTTMSVNMTLGNVLRLNQIPPSSTLSLVTPVRDHPDDPIDQTQAVDMIFPRGDLFTTLFCSYDAQWNRVIPQNGTPDLSRYKYLAHVRNINTVNMADAGVEDVGLFSVIVSHRCGPAPGPKRQLNTPRVTPPPKSPVNINLPKSVIVHLVSLEGVEPFIKLPLSNPATTVVGLVSLYSWTYTCLAPDNVNFVDSMRAIGRQIPQPLRAPDVLINSLKLGSDSNPGPTKSAQRLRDRLMDGYSLLRYLPRSGEQTVAFSRGPLTPTLPTHPPKPFWPSQGTFSTSFQTLDAHLGIMDVTYSTAWELGRTLAIADRAFTAAVVRVRRATNIHATTEAKKEMMGVSFRGKRQIIGSLPDAIKLLADIPKDLADGTRVVDPVKRWMPSQVDATAAPPEALGSSPEMRKLFVKHAHAAVKVLSSASTVSGKSDGQGDLLPFNEINIPNNTDWSLILAWIVNKLHLYNIPAHYLITDPTHLPKESIRFFYIDPTWLDSLIDGALSVGNHLERDDDVVRQAMKFNLNKYFATPIHQDHHPFTPQIPTYGFFLRSAVVQAFPNLQVHAPWPGSTPANPDPRVETLRLDLLDKDLLICLFDRLPGSLDFASGITISQPPHQQRFAAGNDRVKAEVKNANEVEFIFRRVYTSTEVEPPPNTWADLSLRAWGEGEGEISHTVDPKSKILDPPNPSVIFDWDNNTLVVEAFAKTCNNVLLQEMDKKYFDDATPSSALVGIQLNDANKVITILTPRDSPPNPNPRPDSRPRFIHLTADDLPPAAPVTALSSIEQIVAAPRPAGIFPAGDLPPAAPVTALGSIEQLTTVPRPAGIFPGMFHSSAFVIGNVGNPTLPTHPSNSLNLPVDIIFALTLSGQINDSLNLFQVRIRIPIGTALGHLFAVYDGPGGRMLSNQRFNVHVGSATTDNFVFVTLIPRSTTQLVPLKVNPDVSFILNQVRLNGVAGLVNMIVEEDYRVKGEGDDPTKWPLVGPGRTLITVRKVIISST